MPDSTAQTSDVPTTDASIGLSETPTVPQASSSDFQSVVPHNHNGINSPFIDKASNGLPSLPMSVANGGIGGTSLAAHGVLVGNGTSAVSVTGTGTSGQVLTSNGASSDPTFQTPGAGTTASTFTAGEALTAGNSVAVGTGLSYDNILVQGSQNTSTATTNWYGQTFTVPVGMTGVTKVKLWLGANGGNPNDTITLAFRGTTAGLPNNFDQAGRTATGLMPLTSAEITFDFSAGGALTLTPGNVHSFVLRGLQRGGPLSDSVFYQNTDVYSGGQMVTSTDSGATWSAVTGNDLYFKLTGIQTVAGQVYKTDATFTKDKSDCFVGFAAANAVSGASVSVNTGGIDSNQTGLTVGSTYFLSNTPGAIASSAGTVSRKVGMATATTGILIKHDNL